MLLCGEELNVRCKSAFLVVEHFGYTVACQRSSCNSVHLAFRLFHLLRYTENDILFHKQE